MSSSARLVTRLNVVYLYARDVARSRAFYRDVLGVPLEGDEHWQGAVHRLREAGVLTGTVMRDTWGAAVELVDPDGYRVHLFQPPA